MSLIKNKILCILLITLSAISMQLFATQELQITDNKALDRLWDTREQKKVQTEILNFIKSMDNIPHEFQAAYKISRLSYFIGNFGLGEDLKKDTLLKVFEVGVQAGEIAKDLEPERVEGYYWYAVNLGKLSLLQSKFKALKNAKIGRDALLVAAKLDPTYHWAGPYRILGKYYQEVPSTISFGDKKLAYEYYQKSLEVSGEYKLNMIYLSRLIDNKQEKFLLLKKAEKQPKLDGKLEESRYMNIIRDELGKLD